MIWIAAAAAALLLAYAALLGFANASIARIKAVAAWTAGAVGLGLVGLMLATGRGAQALWWALLAAPLIWRWRQAMRTAGKFRRSGRPTPGRDSTVRSAFVEVRLDHDTGTMLGTVLAGSFAGRAMEDLPVVDLLALRAEAAADADSLALIEAWLDRVQADWRQAADPPPAAAGPMTRDDALEILGLERGATEAEIRSAHRRLMATAHPDRGGSDWLAARINQARDVLLGD
jgi:hypothetical protein